MNKTPLKILIVEDDKNVLKSLKITLEDAMYQVATASSAVGALEKIDSDHFDGLIFDIRLDGPNSDNGESIEVTGLQLFHKIRSLGISTPVLFISGNASLTEAVDAIRLGGTDFLEKPFTPERLLIAVARLLRLGDLENTLRDLRGKSTPSLGRSGFLGNSSANRILWEQIKKAAPTKSKILIQGESGTGKELIARAVHDLSSVSQGPFIKVNCAAIPADLIESELFGHERGAFTGATQLKRGLFEMANQGTIFLDEIAEMSLPVQAKVLRVLQNQDFTRVGGTVGITVDVRIIAATHKNLDTEVKLGRFREDLFFRISVVPLSSTPLREKKEDIPILLNRFILQCCEENGFAPKDISAEAVELLMAYSWPGNVRELRNLVERLVIFSGEQIEKKDLPEDVLVASSSNIPIGNIRWKAELGAELLSLKSFHEKTERAYIIEVLKKMNGNISKAAALLDIERTYLHRKIQDLKIRKSEYF